MTLLTREIAEAIVKETMNRLHRNINIMDESGVIIASGDPTRVGERHEGALQVVRTGRALIIKQAEANRWPGSRSGINLPIQFQDKIVGVIGITGRPEEVEEFGGIVKMTTELMIKQSYLASQLEWLQHTKEMVIEELIKSQIDHERIDQLLHMLALKLSPPYQLFLIELKERTIQNHVLMRQIEQIVGPERHLIGFVNVHRLFILLSGLTEERCKDKLLSIANALDHAGLTFRVGCGTEVHEREKISTAYQEAALALTVGGEGERIILYSDVQTKALIYEMNDEVKQRYITRIFARTSPKLIKTLQVFFACNCNITETAKSLYVHRNTLIYRLKKIKEETGCDPQLFQDAVSLQMAAWMFEQDTSD
ncbi:CdaR family transcriptional regulator [Brevibacillus humidisoli]|uniref:CdaR family transcriptional regulator n=1 Tax=Brevibacillus humidisoli TaxID=2895522 RepID=UPI0024080B1A|nr:sugar diacid recognition domain-containing protein [Brevibacillus humidisoli]